MARAQLFRRSRASAAGITGGLDLASVDTEAAQSFRSDADTRMSARQTLRRLGGEDSGPVSPASPLSPASPQQGWSTPRASFGRGGPGPSDGRGGSFHDQRGTFGEGRGSFNAPRGSFNEGRGSFGQAQLPPGPAPQRGSTRFRVLRARAAASASAREAAWLTNDGDGDAERTSWSLPNAPTRSEGGARLSHARTFGAGAADSTSEQRLSVRSRGSASFSATSAEIRSPFDGEDGRMMGSFGDDSLDAEAKPQFLQGLVDEILADTFQDNERVSTKTEKDLDAEFNQLLGKWEPEVDSRTSMRRKGALPPLVAAGEAPEEAKPRRGRRESYADRVVRLEENREFLEAAAAEQAASAAAGVAQGAVVGKEAEMDRQVDRVRTKLKAVMNARRHFLDGEASGSVGASIQDQRFWNKSDSSPL